MDELELVHQVRKGALCYFLFVQIIFFAYFIELLCLRYVMLRCIVCVILFYFILSYLILLHKPLSNLKFQSLGS